MPEKFIREEKDGSKTETYAEQWDGKWVTHNIKGPAVINKTQDITEYYLYGVKCTKEDWDKKRKYS